MKTLSILITIAFLNVTSMFAQKKPLEKELKMYERVWYDILNNGQIDLINDENFDPNIIQLNYNENIVGLADFKAYYQNYITGFSNISFDVIDVFGQGTKIMKHWRFKGTHTGEFFGIPATGNNVNLEGVTIVKMKKGRITQEQDFIDNAVLMQQLGIVSNLKNITVIDGLYKAFATGDITSVLGAMDANIIWNEAEGNKLADGNPYVGPDAVLNGVFARLGAEHEYFTLEDIKLHDMCNNQVLATLRYDAKNKATGKSYNAQVAHLWTLKDGKIVAFQQFADTKKLADAEQQ